MNKGSVDHPPESQTLSEEAVWGQSGCGAAPLHGNALFFIEAHMENPQKPTPLFSMEETEVKPPGLSFLTEDNLEKLEALSIAWGIPIEWALNVSVSDAYDQKIAGMREASGD